MAYIKVDHSKFAQAASAIDRYTTHMRNKMNASNTAVGLLRGVWQGKDFDAFISKWDTSMDKQSVYMQMYSALNSYAEFLRYAGEQYKKAQTDAVNRANKL